jgi:hypothetical protein
MQYTKRREVVRIARVHGMVHIPVTTIRDSLSSYAVAITMVRNQVCLLSFTTVMATVRSVRCWPFSTQKNWQKVNEMLPIFLK